MRTSFHTEVRGSVGVLDAVRQIRVAHDETLPSAGPRLDTGTPKLATLIHVSPDDNPDESPEHCEGLLGGVM